MQTQDAINAGYVDEPKLNYLTNGYDAEIVAVDQGP